MIDAATNKLLDDLTVGTSPRGLAVDPSTDRIFVANQDSGTISVIEGPKDTVSATVRVTGSPVDLAVDWAHRVYAAERLTGEIAVVDGANNSYLGAVHVGSAPTAVSVDAKTRRVFVGNLASDSLTVLKPPS